VLTVDANVWVAAFDPHDRFHLPSVRFLRAVADADLRLHAPAFLVVEVACALARRAGDAAVGRDAGERLRTHPSLTLHLLDDGLLIAAREIGVRHLIRGADALYAATAMVVDAPLVSWDDELVRRAGGVTPDSWLSRRS
jgi:predicted nucleic acid-binding protein